MPQPGNLTATQALPGTWLNKINQMTSSNGQPQGMLIDIGVAQPDLQHNPDVLVNPISIARVQSAYRAADIISGMLVITLIVTNNQAPAVAPQLPAFATVTETMAALAAFDSTSDSNLIRNVLVADNLLTAHAVLASALLTPRISRQTTCGYL